MRVNEPSPAAAATAAECAVHVPPVQEKGESRTRVVTAVTAVMMVAELVAGFWTHSLALTADGWHMATHVGALGLSAVAYWYARTRAGETRFAFGTGKVYALAGYTSAAFLIGVALFVAWEGIQRLMVPEAVRFADALPVAVLGLVVNLVCAWLLDVPHSHDHAHSRVRPRPHLRITALPTSATTGSTQVSPAYWPASSATIASTLVSASATTWRYAARRL
ncbi:MAG: cation efflux system protein [Myxococcaceae bacterium]|nr:cation efflux system protein [Myxococcaceae bacterium]